MADDVALKLKQSFLQGRSLGHMLIAPGNHFVHPGIVLFLIKPCQIGLRQIAALCSHGNQVLIKKRDSQAFCHTFPQLAATAAQLSADCQYLMRHNAFLPIAKIQYFIPS